jgi:hypothetical protein
MATYQITVVCEYVLSGRCSESRCGAYGENRISSGTAKQLDTGQLYYPYCCSGGIASDVKLLDINFKLKNNPNILFKQRKKRR